MPSPPSRSIRKSAISQLRDCLKLHNNTACLNAIVDNILEVGRKNLDPVILASHQKSALIAIREELGGLYPDIFADEDSEKRLYIALQIAMHQHNLNRRGLKEKGNKPGQSPHQEKERTPASKLASKRIQHSISTPKPSSSERGLNQTLVDVKKYAKDKPSDNRKTKKIRSSLRTSISGCKEQNKNQAPTDVTMHATDKASDTRSIIPHTGRPPSPPMQGDENGHQAPMHVTDKVLDKPPTSKQGFNKEDEDHVPLHVTMHVMDMVSGKKVKTSDSQRPLSAPSQGFDENQVPMHVPMHVTDKTSGKMTAETILYNRHLSLIPTHEQDEAPINVTMHGMDKVFDGKKTKMPPSDRMVLHPTNTPSAPGVFVSPVFEAHAPQLAGSESSLFSHPRGRVLFVPHVSKSQSQLDKTQSRPRSIDDSCFGDSSASRSYPMILSPASDTSSFSTSEDSPIHRCTVLQSDVIKSMHHFLEACVPSMSHLLQRFIDYGCTHDGFLLAVSMWPPERIRKFLEDVVSGPDGQSISPMEQMVLENHLTQYFKV